MIRLLQIPIPAVPIQVIETPWLSEHRVELAVLRADLADPLLSGNKFFKLKYNLLNAAQQNQRHLLSFGGPWSNHLHALAAAGQRFGFATTGIVRGEAESLTNACLQDAVAMGMRLHFVTREEYRRKNSPEFLTQLTQQYGAFYLIQEGGANFAGIRGCQELLPPDLAADFTHIALACGTGTTMAGVITGSALPVMGIQVLKGTGYLQAEVAATLQRHNLAATAEWTMLDEFHGGGYGRTSQQLLAFMEQFSRTTHVPLEPVYSGKLFLALHQLVTRGYFPEGVRILAIHGGGLQGARGFIN